MEDIFTIPPIVLTKREKEIVGFICEGLSSKMIAIKLFLSTKTIEVHRQNIMKKTGVGNSIMLVRYAVKKGIYPLGEFLK